MGGELSLAERPRARPVRVDLERPASWPVLRALLPPADEVVGSCPLGARAKGSDPGQDVAEGSRQWSLGDRSEDARDRRGATAPAGDMTRFAVSSRANQDRVLGSPFQREPKYGLCPGSVITCRRGVLDRQARPERPCRVGGASGDRSENACGRCEVPSPVSTRNRTSRNKICLRRQNALQDNPLRGRASSGSSFRRRARGRTSTR